MEYLNYESTIMKRIIRVHLLNCGYSITFGKFGEEFKKIIINAFFGELQGVPLCKGESVSMLRNPFSFSSKEGFPRQGRFPWQGRVSLTGK